MTSSELVSLRPTGRTRFKEADFAVLQGRTVIVSKDDLQLRGKIILTPQGVRVVLEPSTEAHNSPIKLQTFVKQAGYKRNFGLNEAAEHIKLDDGSDILTAVAACERGTAALAGELKRLAVHSVADLESLTRQEANRVSVDVCFRVCRRDEDPSEGIRITGTCLRETSTRAVDYCTELTNHVWQGSRRKVRKSFISATKDIKQALWWAYGGVHKVVAIDLTKLPPDCLCWDVSGKHSKLLYSPMAQEFARMSAEVVLDNNVPPVACEVLQVSWAPLTARSPRLLLLPDCKAMPAKLPPGPTDVELLAVLNGSTMPLHVRLHCSESRSQEQAELDGVDGSGNGAECSGSGIGGEFAVLQDRDSQGIDGKHLKRRIQPVAEQVGGSSSAQAEAEDDNFKGKASKRRKRSPDADVTYVLKRGGFRQLDPLHSYMEFAALKMYHAAGLKVPSAALYPIKVQVHGRHELELAMAFLMTRFIDGVPFKKRLLDLAADQGQTLRLKETVRTGVAMDVALSNMDVCGPDYSNLVVVVKAGKPDEVDRVDAGGCMQFCPRGSQKELKFFDGTSSSIDNTIKAFTEPPKRTYERLYSTTSSVSGTSCSDQQLVSKGGGIAAGGSQDATVPAYQANKNVFRLNIKDLAASAKTILGNNFEAIMNKAVTKQFDSSMVAALATVTKRLHLMADMGSTPTPLIPLSHGRSTPVAAGDAVASATALAGPAAALTGRVAAAVGGAGGVDSSGGSAGTGAVGNNTKHRLQHDHEAPSEQGPSGSGQPNANGVHVVKPQISSVSAAAGFASPIRVPAMDNARSSLRSPPPQRLLCPGPTKVAPKDIQVISIKGIGKSLVKWEEKGYKAVNVTSKSDSAKWKQLSPFHPHGGIPVPENPNRFSQSVEGLWQGLKVFENESVDLTKLNNSTGSNLKRSGKKRGKVRGHWWAPLPSNGSNTPQHQLLGYAEARRKIYLPAYDWVLKNRVHNIVKQLAKEALTSKIVLVDYFTNDDVDNTDVPLSHAGLLRKYILAHFEELVGPT